LKKRLFNVLKILFFLGLGVVLIWLALRDKSAKEIDEIIQSIRNANYFWLCLSLVITGLSHYFRATRWRLMLKPLGHSPKVSNAFFSVMVGYLTNLAILRAGEVTRCGILTKYEKIPFVEGFGTVIAERALDLICLILVFFIVLGIEFDKIYGIANDLIFKGFSEKWNALMQKQMLLIVVGVVIFMVFAALLYFRKKIKALLSQKVIGFVKGLWDGLLSTKRVDKPILFFAYTGLIWLMYILQVYVCFFAFQETAHLSFVVAMVIVAFGSLGVIAVPGGTGAYQIIVIQILVGVYFISNPSANAFAWAVWTSQIMIVLALGFISLILLPVLNKEAK
jgi:uncharacterized protein (TIRG00374 family)